MKRIVSFLTALVLVVSMFAVSVSATTKADLIEEASKSPIYKYVRVAVENAARTIEITDEQAEQLLPIVRRAVAAVPEDLGPTARNDHDIYTYEQIEIIMSCVDEACAILGYTHENVTSTDPKHIGDIVFMIYNEDNELVFQYDGDVVADTSAASETDTTELFIGAVALLLAGGAVLAVSKKRATVR